MKSRTYNGRTRSKCCIPGFQQPLNQFVSITRVSGNVSIKHDRKFEFCNTNRCKKKRGQAYLNCCLLRTNYVNMHVA